MGGHHVHRLQYISFSSSGFHGFVFDGVLRALEDHVPDFDNWQRSVRGVAGTSGGAIAALVFALGIPREQRRTVLGQLTDVTNIFRCPNISLMWNEFGIEDGEGLRSTLRDMLRIGGLSPTSTLADLRRLLRIDISFSAHSMLTGKAVRLTAETFPSMPVADAVFASCCIPLMFAPSRSEDGVVLCDGAFSEYIPQVYPMEHTLHIYLPPTTVLAGLLTWTDFLRSFLLTTIAHQASALQDLEAHANTVHVAHPLLDTIDSMQPGVAADTAAMIAHCGYVAQTLYLYPTLATLLTTLVRRYTECLERVGRLSEEEGHPTAMCALGDGDDGRECVGSTVSDVCFTLPSSQ